MPSDVDAIKYRIYAARHKAHRDVANLIQMQLGGDATTFTYFSNPYATEKGKQRYRRELDKLAWRHFKAADRYWQKMSALPLPTSEENDS